MPSQSPPALLLAAPCSCPRLRFHLGAPPQLPPGIYFPGKGWGWAPGPPRGRLSLGLRVNPRRCGMLTAQNEAEGCKVPPWGACCPKGLPPKGLPAEAVAPSITEPPGGGEHSLTLPPAHCLPACAHTENISMRKPLGFKLGRICTVPRARGGGRRRFLGTRPPSAPTPAARGARGCPDKPR